MNFIALDFETANPNLSSVCQVGIVKFQEGVLVDSFDSLISPNGYFSNTFIHGIDSDDVIDAPIFEKIYPKLVQMLSGQIVVSHTPFDRAVLQQTLARCRLPTIECRWLDSARVVRRTWTAHARSGYGLRSIASKLEIAFEHHDALEDARTAGIVLLRAIAESGICVEDWLVKSLLPIHDEPSNVSLEGNPSGALFGQHLVFTGALQVPRREAAALAALIGCTVTDFVTKKTSILVVGDQDIARFSVGQTKSSKHRKVETLIQAGATIRIIGESDFISLCSTEPSICENLHQSAPVHGRQD